jgi:Spy/CpxP family protein refolding chaperone
MRLAVVVSVGCWLVLAGAYAQAQPQRGPGGAPGGGPGGFGGGFGSLADVLRRQDVRTDLELLDDQVAQLEKLAEGRREQMRELFSGLRDVPQEERGAKMRELVQKAQKDLEADVGKILLPHQMKRAKQLVTQMQMRGGRGMLSEPIAQDLGLTDAQKEQLQAKSAQLEEEVRKKLAELRAQSQNELLKVLTPAQQAKWKEMVGEPFEFQREEQPRATGDRPQGGAPPAERPRRGGR